MKVLVVDDDEDFRALARNFLLRSYPRALVADYDPRTRGLPPSDFPWADYDLVLLDHELSAEQTGLDWLRRFSHVAGFPAVIFATGAGDERLAARAMKFGADEYLSKRDMSADRLGELVSSVIAARTAPPGMELPAGAPPPGVRALDAPSPVPGYELRQLLGCGGTADVFLAERASDGLTVVVKILREGMVGNRVVFERLMAEGRLLESIDDPQVVRVYSHGEVHGRAYLVMEYLGHGDLRPRIAEGLGVDEALAHATELARGLACIHARGVIHRDIKPGNVMFRYDDSLALTDFGIARRSDRESQLTGTGSVLGTPSYMSPEQCEGEPADARSDLYALGVVLYEMLTGVRPVRGDVPGVLFMQHLSAPVPELPAALASCQGLIDGLLAKDPAHRFQDAETAIEALELARGA